MARERELFQMLLGAVVEAHLGERAGFSQCWMANLGDSPLHGLVRQKNVDGLRKFLKTFKRSVDIVDRESGVTPLVAASFYGNLGAVKLLVQRGANVNHGCSGVNKEAMKYSNITPIYLAAEEGHESVVEYLAKNGADVNAQMSPLGYTPIHRAVLHGHEDVVVLLVKLKAKVGIPCIEIPRCYPIFSAVAERKTDIIEYLLTAVDADPDIAEPSESTTPLHFAAYNADLQSIEVLLAHGADVNVQLKSGHTPLDLAVQEKNWHVIEYLKEHGARRKIHDKSWQPFGLCVANGILSLKAAINRGVDINSSIQKGGTALHYCVVKRRMDACKLLIRKGADLERRDVFGRTPLYFAADMGLNHFVEFLLEKGANINAQSDVGLTPLHAAAAHGHYSTCRLLVSKGANLEAMAREMGTPLASALATSHTSIVKLLLKSGANPNARNPEESVDRVSVLQVGIMYSSDKPEIIRALVEAGANVNDPIITPEGTITLLHLLPLITDNVDTLKILIEAGTFIDPQSIVRTASKTVKIHVKTGVAVDQCMSVAFSGTPLQTVKKSGRPGPVRLLEKTTALFKAVRKNDVALAEKFYSEGGLINCCSVRYDTPLIYASWKGYRDMVQFLLERGAKIDMPNVQNCSPLHYAAKYNQKAVCVLLLKTSGSLVNAKCGKKTPLDLAQENGHADLASILTLAQRWLDESGADQLPRSSSWKTDPKFSQVLADFDGKVAEEDFESLFGII